MSYNIMLVSGVQHSALYIYIYYILIYIRYILFQILFPCRLL